VGLTAVFVGVNKKILKNIFFCMVLHPIFEKDTHVSSTKIKLLLENESV